MNLPPTMNLPQPDPPAFTLQDWASWEGRWELIDGVAYDMTPSPAPIHQEILARVWSAIDGALGGRRTGKDCKAYFAPLDLFLPREESVYQPDLVMVCDPSLVTGRGIKGVPDLVAEVLSPSTAKRDLWIKRGRYEAAGIPEYLIVDPDERQAELLRLDPGGRYRPMGKVPFGGTLGLLGDRIRIRIEP